MKSKSNGQLAGEELSVDDIKSDCDPVYLNEHLDVEFAIDGKTKLVKDAPANPCGLIAKSLFNDTYSFSQDSSNIFINETGIAW